MDRKTTVAGAFGTLVGLALLVNGIRLIEAGDFFAVDWWFYQQMIDALYSGILPYQTTATLDNKPPLYFGLLYVIGFFGGTDFVYTVSAALSTGILSGLLIYLSWDETNWLGGIIAGILFVSSLYSIDALRNGMRMWPILMMLIAVYFFREDKPIHAGIAVAIGGTTWQFIGLTMFPLLVGFDRGQYKPFLVATFAVVGVVLIVPEVLIQSPHGPLYASVWTAIQYIAPVIDLGVPETFRLASNGKTALFENPGIWLGELLDDSWQLLPLYPIALLSAKTTWIEVGILVMTLPLLSKMHLTYWLILLPWLVLGVVQPLANTNVDPLENTVWHGQQGD